MRVSSLTVLVGALAAASGWFVRGIPFDPQTAPKLQASPVRAVSSTSSAEPPDGVIEPLRIPAALHGSRNLFAYVTHDVAPRQPVVLRSSPPVVAVVTVPMPVQENPAPSRPRFPYRYIGRFGPERNPVAAFALDGEIVTARPGDRIGQHFRLRSVGLETVEVEASTKEENYSERVALGGSSR
ncbi:MAG TPA: hypothetical protein VEK57_06775 [Thermoanaerobaculia bacterium]|nr:hypothetical protein [Thermoanaerobaculia bacterium]